MRSGDKENVGNGGDIVYAHSKGECGEDRGEHVQGVADHWYTALAVAIRQNAGRTGGRDLHGRVAFGAAIEVVAKMPIVLRFRRQRETETNLGDFLRACLALAEMLT